MYTRTRSIVLAVLVLSTGCRSTGGKIFGTVSLASAAASSYMLANSGSSIEGHTLVTHDDDRRTGGALLITAVLAAGGWAFCELMERDPTFGGAWGVVAAGPVAPAEAGPVAPVADPPAEPPAPPAADPAPPLVVIAGPGGGPAPPLPRYVWRVDPSDGQHKLYAPDDEYVGRLDTSGEVWDRIGVLRGRVAIAPTCALACRRSQAARMLLGLPMKR